ncbi:hypothetical protein Tco_0933981 [Tanacetum coccineum]
MANHSQKWHNRESNQGLGGTSSDGMSVITNKLNDLGRDMRKLKESVHTIQVGREMCGGTHLVKNCHLIKEVKSIKAHGYGQGKNEVETTKYMIGPSRSHLTLDKRSSIEETIERYVKESTKRQDGFEEWMKRFTESTDKNLKRHDSAIKGLEKKVEQLAQAVHASMTNDFKSVNQVKTLENVTKIGESNRTPRLMLVIGTFVEKIIQKSLQEFMSKEIKIEEVSMVKLSARCSAVLQNELPSKEKDPGSFILPCIIGNMTINQCNPLRESLKTSWLKWISFDIVEDDKVPIILGRPMLVTVHARIDVFSKKILLKYETRRGKSKILTLYANPERQFRARKDITPMSVHNIYLFYESESSELESEEIGESNIETLAMEQNKDEDAYEHVEKVLEITSLFSIPGVSKDLIMLRVFPITLVGTVKRWITAKQLENIHNFRQEGNETLYQAWERSRHEKLKESVHAIQVGCEMCGGKHLVKNWHLIEEVKSIKATGYGEGKNEVKTTKYLIGPSGSHSTLDKRSSLEETIKRYVEKSTKRQDSFEEWMK